MKGVRLYNLVLCLFISFLNSAQNLVPNPSFETMSCCPQNIGGNGDFPCATSWIRVQCSPDYFNPCDVSTNNLGVPSNAFGLQAAHGGSAYGGIYTFNKFQPDGGRDYIEIMLLNPLVASNKYLVSLYVSLADNMQYSTNTIGVYFSNTQLSGSNCNLLPYIPQVQNLSSNALTDKNNWMLISDTLYSNGGEQYIVIGNFMTGTLSDTLFLGGSINGSYYYIDDISVIDVIDLGIEQNNSSDYFSIYPNPANNNFKITCSIQHIEYKIQLCDVLGNVIKTQEIKNKEEIIDVNGLDEGVYFINVKTTGNTAVVKKIIVQR